MQHFIIVFHATIKFNDSFLYDVSIRFNERTSENWNIFNIQKNRLN